MATKPVIIYADLMSPPARAVYWFCKLAKIPHEVKILNIGTGEHLTDDYRKMYVTLGLLTDHPVTLSEKSQQLMITDWQFLKAQKYNASDNWYPKDLSKRAKIESYLDWQHLNLRKSTYPLFFSLFIMGMDPQEPKLEQSRKDTADGLKVIDTYWLQGKKFIGGEEPSIADLSALCEMENLILIKWDFSPYSNLRRWMADMEAMEGFSDVHTAVNEVKARIGAKL